MEGIAYPYAIGHFFSCYCLSIKLAQCITPLRLKQPFLQIHVFTLLYFCRNIQTKLPRPIDLPQRTKFSPLPLYNQQSNLLPHGLYRSNALLHLNLLSIRKTLHPPILSHHSAPWQISFPISASLSPTSLSTSFFHQLFPPQLKYPMPHILFTEHFFTIFSQYKRITLKTPNSSHFLDVLIVLANLLRLFYQWNVIGRLRDDQIGI